MEKNLKFRIERITEEQFPDLEELLLQSGQKKIDFSKKYDCSHLKTSVLGAVMYLNSSTPVAFTAELPYLLSYKGNKFLAAQSCDTLTHPQYYRRGLSTQLFQYCTSTGIEEKMSGFFAVVNEFSGAVLTKLKWTELAKFKRYEISIKTLPVWSIFNRLGMSQIYTRFAMIFLKKYLIAPVSFNSFSDEEYLIVERSREHIEYKSNFGNFFLKINEVIFWVKINYGQLYIGDINATSETELLSAMDKICQSCVKLGLRKIVFQTQTGSSLQHYFANNYNSIDSSRVFCQDLGSGIPFEKLKLTFADFDTF